MNSHELGCEVQMIKEITSSEGAIKRYFLGKNDGIVLKTVFVKLIQDLVSSITK